MEKVVAYLEDIYARIEIVLTAYTLKVIRKSGRVSAAAAIAGDLLGIHPIFTLNDGVSQVVKKIRWGQSCADGDGGYDEEPHGSRLPVLYCGIGQKVCRRIYPCLHGKGGYGPVSVFVLGCAVLSNTGPDAVGLIYEGQKRER